MYKENQIDNWKYTVFFFQGALPIETWASTGPGSLKRNCEIVEPYKGSPSQKQVREVTKKTDWPWIFCSISDFGLKV